jgi:hypothetical protein
VSALPAFLVQLPPASCEKLPVDLHVRRFEHAPTYQAYIRAWSEAGYVLQFENPFSCRVLERVQ